MTTTAQGAEIPAMCCAVGNHNWNYDMASSWTCHRAARIYHLRGDVENIRQQEARLPRLRSPRRRANLARWIEEAKADHGRHLRQFHDDDPACVRPDWTGPTVELAPCTCA